MREEDKVKTTYEVRPEGTQTAISELAMQHMQSSSVYRDIASALAPEEETAAGYFTSLAKYHDELLAKLNELLGDMSAGVNTPSRSGQSLLKEEEESVNRAVVAKNLSELSELAHRNEHTLSQAYEHALANTKLLDFAEEVLHEQHQEVLVWVNRADRYKTVPQESNDHYDTND